MTNTKKLILHDFHLKNSARFTDFAGWSMPVSFGSSMEEHIQTRKSATVFDVSHMGEIQVVGNDSTWFLEEILTNSILNTKVGRAVYSPICNENGGTVDDLIVYKKAEDNYLLCVNASNIHKDLEHMLKYSKSFNCEISDLSPTVGQLAIQGPESCSILSELLGYDLSGIKKMSFIEKDIYSTPALVSRTGYTGEDGFEIYCDNKSLLNLANDLHKFVNQGRLRWGGLAARDSLRLEAGYPLYGNELTDEITPVQAGLLWAISWQKENFLGRKALLAEKENLPAGKVFFYEVDDRITPRKGDILYFNNSPSGKVLSGGFSPLLKKPIGSIWVDTKKSKNREEKGWRIKVRNKEIEVVLSLPVLKKYNSASFHL